MLSDGDTDCEMLETIEVKLIQINEGFLLKEIDEATFAFRMHVALAKLPKLPTWVFTTSPSLKIRVQASRRELHKIFCIRERHGERRLVEPYRTVLCGSPLGLNRYLPGTK